MALVALIVSGVCAEPEMKNRDGSPIQQPMTVPGSASMAMFTALRRSPPTAIMDAGVTAGLMPIAATPSADLVFSTLVAAVGAVRAGAAAGEAAFVADLASDGPWTVGASSTRAASSFATSETDLSFLLSLPASAKALSRPRYYSQE